MDTSRTVNKLKMLGFHIEGYNEFGIVYRKNKKDNLNLLKFTDCGGETRQEVISDFSEFGIAKHFIDITRHEGRYPRYPYRLYVKSKAEPVLRIETNYPDIIFYDENKSITGKRIAGDYEILIYKVYEERIGKLVIINYNGKQLEIKGRVRQDYTYTESMQRQSDGTYIIGYGKPSSKSNMFFRWTNELIDKRWIVDKDLTTLQEIPINGGD